MVLVVLLADEHGDVASSRRPQQIELTLAVFVVAWTERKRAFGFGLGELEYPRDGRCSRRRADRPAARAASERRDPAATTLSPCSFIVVSFSGGMAPIATVSFSGFED
jgi:hypothetical protein